MKARPAPAWKRRLGIVGGLGPYAHLDFERELLRAAGPAGRDQEYPPWTLVSVPGAPDRTAALSGDGESPAPWLVDALERLAPHADFAVIACVTAHAFLAEVRDRVSLPILDLVAETARAAAGLGCRRLGVLATTGTLSAGLFEAAASRLDPPLATVSPLDLPGGDELQRELVMLPVYGGRSADGATVAGLKAGAAADPGAHREATDRLRRAGHRLFEDGADGLVLGCTEIPLALGHEPLDGRPLIDPLRVGAVEALRILRGEREPPPRARP